MSLADILRKKHSISGLRSKYLGNASLRAKINALRKENTAIAGKQERRHDIRPLHWFLALSSRPSVLPFGDYEQMARVAVITARERTNLIPHFLYDGEE